MWKKILKRTLITLLVLIGILLAAPFLFKKQIVAFVKKQINQNLTAQVDFKNVDISFFRHFPRVAVGLEELQVIGTGSFSADTLLAAKKVDAALDIMSVIKGDHMTIYSVAMDQPRIHAIVNKEGLANWDIVKPDTATKASTPGKPFTLNLQSYRINDATIFYTDQTAAITTAIEHLNHEGSGDFTANQFTLKTSTDASSVSVGYGGIAYLSDAKAKVIADIQIDNVQHTYSFNTDQILVNDLALTAAGKVKDLAEKGYDMDINFKAPSTDFKKLLSLVPTIYQHDFDKVNTSGTALFSGFVKGVYNETTIPAYHVDLAVNNGFFKYPDLPRPLENINVKAQIDNPDGVTDHTIVNIEKGHFEMDKAPFDFRLLVKNPITNLFVDAAAKGKLDLSKISQLVKLEKGTTIKGLFDADVNVKGNVADIEKQRYDQFSAGGKVALTNFNYTAAAYPTGVSIDALQTSFTPAKVNINSLNGSYLGTRFNGDGEINNLLNYLLQNKPLSATINIGVDQLDLNKWMGTSTDTTTKGTAAAPFAVPANLDVLVNAKADKVHYDKLDITNLTGKMKVIDESVALADVKGNALDGTIGLSGVYSTKESKSQPVIALNYDVQKVDVQKTFYAFNTMQKLMPIGKFIAGKLTSQLLVKGRLGDNMMPDLNSLTGNGNLLLIEGFLSKFAPLDKIANTLNVKALEQVSLKDIKNYIEFSNGKVLIKPFPVTVGTVKMEIGGLHGFNQSLDYLINLQIPRALMGEKGNQLVNNLVAQVNNKGVPLKVGDIVNLNLKLGGSISSPTVTTDLKQGVGNLADQMKQQAADFVKAKVDSTKTAVTNAVKDTIASVKKQALATAKDELTKKLLGGGSGDSTKSSVKPAESLKGLVNDLFKKKKKDTTGTKP